MTHPFEVWRRNLLLWVVPAGVCVLGALGLVIYYGTFDGRVETLANRHEAITAKLAEYRQESQEISEFLARVDGQDRKIDQLYLEHFETEDERFTRVLQEVKKLARDAGLQPTSFDYPIEVVDDYDLIRRGISFSVVANYQQLRTFINFLELTDQFLTLESIGLSGKTAQGSNPTLNINLKLATFFATSLPEAPAPSAEEVASEDSDQTEDAESAEDPEQGDVDGEEET